MPILIGIALAIAVGVFATIVGFDRSRGFYPVVLIVIASYYELFAAMGGPISALWQEAVILAAFIAVAVIGMRTSQWLIVAGLLAHGGIDAVHGLFIENAGVPVWWPAFCAAYDVAAAAWLATGIMLQPRSAGDQAP